MKLTLEEIVWIMERLAHAYFIKEVREVMRFFSTKMAEENEKEESS